jgi:methyl-accepting chemotaxis protein
MLGSLRRLLIAGMAVLLGLVAAVTALAISSLDGLDRSVEFELQTLIRAGSASTGLVAAIAGETRAADEYLVRPTPREKHDFATNGDSAYALQRRYREVGTLSTSDRVLLNRIAGRQAEIEVIYSLAHALADVGRGDAARAQAERVREPADTLLTDVRRLAASQSRHAIERANTLRAQARERRSLLLLLATLALTAGILTLVFTVRSVDVPLSRLIAATDRFGAGDLRPAHLGAMPAELARLALAMDSMATRLRGVVDAVGHESANIGSGASDFAAMSEQLAASSGEISTAMVRMASGAEHQVQGMEEAAAYLAELNQTAQRNSDAATRMVELAERIRAVAGQHRGDVEAAGRSLLDVREVVRTSASQVQELARLSEPITDFIDLVKQISSQTNLLALNAAIEAARAGEHGRGFAVVAEEVRRLADSSAAAAEEVAKTVEYIRRQVREVSTTMEHGSARVSGLESVAQAAVDALDEIATATQAVHAAAAAVVNEAALNRRVVDQVGQKTVEVSQSASEHASASEEVTAAAEEQSASTEEMAASAAELLQAANRLSALMKDFQTA